MVELFRMVEVVFRAGIATRHEHVGRQDRHGSVREG